MLAAMSGDPTAPRSMSPGPDVATQVAAIVDAAE